MKIKYIVNNTNTPVFSFYTTEYQQDAEKRYYVDVQESSYTVTTSFESKEYEGEVRDMIEDIREQFTYKMYRTDSDDENYDKILLKDLSDVQLCDILSYNNSNNPVPLTQEIFIQEIKYRIQNFLKKNKNTYRL